MTAWNVRRTWWELTKLVLAGRGGWEMNGVFHLVAEDTADTLQARNWRPYHIDWIGGDDRYATLCFDAPEEN